MQQKKFQKNSWRLICVLYQIDYADFISEVHFCPSPTNFLKNSVKCFANFILFGDHSLRTIKCYNSSQHIIHSCKVLISIQLLRTCCTRSVWHEKPAYKPHQEHSAAASSKSQLTLQVTICLCNVFPQQKRLGETFHHVHHFMMHMVHTTHIIREKVHTWHQEMDFKGHFAAGSFIWLQ